MRVIVAPGKHDTRLLDASTDEAFASSALALLAERDAEGYWYEEPAGLGEDGDEALLSMTDAQIDALPELVGAQARRARARDREAQQRKRWWTRMRQVVDARSTACDRLGRPAAWMLLLERGDHEYEAVDLVQVEQP